MAVSLQVYEAELNALCEIGQIIGQVLDLDCALEESLKVLARFTAVERAMVGQLDPDKGRLSLKATYGLRPTGSRKSLCKLSERIVRLVFNAAQPFVLPKSGAKLLFSDEAVSSGITKDEIAFLGAPIGTRHESAGILVIDGLFSASVSLDEDIRFLAVLAKFFTQFIDLNRQAREWTKKVERRNRSLQQEISAKYNNYAIVGKNKSMRQLRELVENVAPSTTPVMLLGERGTERALVARVIHELSYYAGGPFIRLTCATIEEGSAGCELLSIFEAAEGGSVFLDDIGSLPVSLQGVILGLFRNRNPESPGIRKTRKTKTGARIIAAADNDLGPAVSAGAFRQDLYYRLNAFPLHIPPLRERNEDIPLLADMFLGKAAREHGKRLTLTPVGSKILKEYSWPGNTFELENLIESLAITLKGPVIDPDILSSLLKSRSLLRQAGIEENRTEP